MARGKHARKREARQKRAVEDHEQTARENRARFLRSRRNQAKALIHRQARNRPNGERQAILDVWWEQEADELIREAKRRFPLPEEDTDV